MGCHRRGSYLCDECRLQVRFAPDTSAIFIFDGLVQNLIHALKYDAQFWVLDFLGEFIIKSKSDFSKIDKVIPIPLHVKRLRERGYNQSVLLAQSWSRKLRCRLDPTTFVRTVDTPSQTGLSREVRRANVKGVFTVMKPQTVLDQSILLVDDVRTTGATLDEAACVLREAGAKQVRTWSVAMVL
jgi:ComF family protein